MRQSDKRESLEQGRDYYWENGRMVLTEAYHRGRGYCCGSGCRHCPYDFEKCAPDLRHQCLRERSLKRKATMCE